MTTATPEPARELSYEEERGKPTPSANHARIQIRLGAEFLQHRQYDTYSELSLRLGFRPLVPDLSVYPAGPMDLRHDETERTEPPLLVVEILSPSQGPHSVMEKIDHYLAHGVKSCWLVTPPLREVTVFTPDGGQQSHHSGVVTEPATGITADLAAVFG